MTEKTGVVPPQEVVGGKKTASPIHSFPMMIFYQDRLGTNIGKTQKRWLPHSTTLPSKQVETGGEASSSSFAPRLLYLSSS
jgi:hypothetical protein